MKKYLKINDIKKISIEGIDLFDQFCRDNNLQYYLAYGTLIGAVRHGGFIPWDDDIDLLMPRKDYERLLKLFNKKNNNPDWELLSYEDTSGYCYYWAKLCSTKTVILPSRFCSGLLYGVSIDIFPLDFMNAKTLEEARAEYEDVRGRLIKGILHTKFDNNYSQLLHKKGKIRHLLKVLYFKLYGNLIHPVCKLYRKIEDEYHNNSGDYITYFMCAYHSIWKTEDFGEGKTIIFEGKQYIVPQNTDDVLKVSYGDYNKLPPKEKQVSNHSYIAFWKN